jgi:PIN domain nuclease of toxin-antitoxin system
LTDSVRLSDAARSLIADPGNEVFFSAATIWEIAIKHTLAKRDMPVSGRDAEKYFVEAGYLELPVSVRHAATTETLPKHHHDPFDRILVAQAIVEPMRLLTHDRKLQAYGELIEFV